MWNNSNFVYMLLLFRQGYLTPPTLPLGSASNYVVGVVGRWVIEVAKGVAGGGGTKWHRTSRGVAIMRFHEPRAKVILPLQRPPVNRHFVFKKSPGSLALVIAFARFVGERGGRNFCLKSEKALFDVQQGGFLVQQSLLWLPRYGARGWGGFAYLWTL